MKPINQMAAAVAMLTLVGCGSVQQAYKPTHLGTLADSASSQGIEITLRPDKSHARIGDPVSFEIVIRNVGTAPISFPEDPDLLLTWVYPDGKRDNLIRSDLKVPSHRMVVLAPGESRVEHSVVTTYYFDHAGITEFRAIVSAADLSVASTRQGWRGRAISNGFGVYFDRN